MNLAKIKSHYINHEDVTSVGLGLKQVKGKLTTEKAIVFGVISKRPRSEIKPERLLPRSVEGFPTDVVETGVFKALALVTKRRPCPPGYSVGHTSVSAGTLGAWVRDQDGSPLMLSNNHVLANSNRSVIGDNIVQPGTADGGFSETDTIARLDRFVGINFHEKEKNKSASLYWKAMKALPNAIARVAGCPYRLEPRIPIRGIEQPTPNLVDAAVAKPLSPNYVNKEAPFVGELKGFGTTSLGDRVQKVGRTTERTEGWVSASDVMVQVSFGQFGTAVFDDQLQIIKGDFSAGGDSGSAILDTENRIVGLLFAGGGEYTLANQIGNVVNLLKIVW